MRTVYEWDSGAYMTSECDDFDESYQELCDQYGEPDFIVEREDWDVSVFQDGKLINCIYPAPPPGITNGRVIKSRG